MKKYIAHLYIYMTLLVIFSKKMWVETEQAKAKWRIQQKKKKTFMGNTASCYIKH